MRRLVPLLLILAGCDHASSDPGVGALLRVNPSNSRTAVQYVPGAMPDDQGGPSITSIGTSSSSVRAGRSTGVSGLVSRGKTSSVALGLPDDAGYWVLQPGVSDLTVIGQLVFEAKLEFSSLTPPGPLKVQARAVDDDGHFGPLQTASLTIQSAPIPDGKMVVTLAWNNQADLDLHALQPDGIEIWSGNVNAYQPPPPGQLPDPLAPGAILDFDSNKQCANDGRGQEDVIWRDPPAAGHYRVRVDTFSLCGEVGAEWSVEVRHDGQLTTRAQGSARDIDTTRIHAEGAGLLALEFDVP